MAGVSATPGTSYGQNPAPWWQTPAQAISGAAANGGGEAGVVGNLESSAPSGYLYNPITQSYQMQPTQAGANVNQFTTAATGGFPGSNLNASLSGLTNAALGPVAGAAGGGTGGAGSTTAGTAGLSTAPTTTGTVASGSGAAPTIGGVAPVDLTQSNAAAFDTAKDQAGQTAAADLASLRGELGSTGQLGSGAEVQATENEIANAAGQEGAVTRQNAVTSAQSAQQVAEANQSAAITQRGQDIQQQEAAAQLGLAQSTLAQNKQLQLLQMAIGLASNATNPNGAGVNTGNVY